MSYEFLVRNIRLLGVVAILVSIVAWTMDITHWVYPCPTCRIQRSVIGALGVTMLLPWVHHWFIRYVATVVGFSGAFAAAIDVFFGISEWSEGKFVWHGGYWFTESVFISVVGLFIITAQLFLIHSRGGSFDHRHDHR